MERQRHLLLVEDDAALRAALRDLLEEGGHQVTCRSNGAEALDALIGGLRPDLIILDLMMPLMDGWRFRIEQRQRPGLARIPVIAISASNSAQAMAIDADLFLEKPAVVEQLTRNIEPIIEAARRRNHQAEHLAQMERLVSLTTLTAGLTHQVNNPLAYVSANLELFARDLPVLLAHCRDCASLRGMERHQLRSILQDGTEMLAEIRQGLGRIRDLMQDMEAFSRIAPERPTAVDLRAVLAQAVRVTANTIAKRAQLRQDLGQAPLVFADEGLLVQVFSSLLLNAAQAVPEGQRDSSEVRVVLSTTAAGGALVRVEDTGVGILPEVLPRIFDPFFTTRAVGEGAGLGLSFCHGIVSRAGGEIRVSSAGPMRGAQFDVVLPPAPASNPAR